MPTKTAFQQAPGTPGTPGGPESALSKLLQAGLVEALGLTEEQAQALLSHGERLQFSVEELAFALNLLHVSEFNASQSVGFLLTITAENHPLIPVLFPGRTPTVPLAVPTLDSIAVFKGRQTLLGGPVIKTHQVLEGLVPGMRVVNPVTGKAADVLSVGGNQIELSADIGLGPRDEFIVYATLGAEPEAANVSLGTAAISRGNFSITRVLNALAGVDVSRIAEMVDPAVYQTAAANLAGMSGATGLPPNPIQAQMAVLQAVFANMSQSIEGWQATLGFADAIIPLIDEGTFRAAMGNVLAEVTRTRVPVVDGVPQFQQLFDRFGTNPQDVWLILNKQYARDVESLSWLHDKAFAAAQVSFQRQAAILATALATSTLPDEMLTMAAVMPGFRKPGYNFGEDMTQWRMAVNEWRATVGGMFTNWFKSQGLYMEQAPILDEILQEAQAGADVRWVLEELANRGYHWQGMFDAIKNMERVLGGGR